MERSGVCVCVCGGGVEEGGYTRPGNVMGEGGGGGGGERKSEAEKERERKKKKKKKKERKKERNKERNGCMCTKEIEVTFLCVF